MATPKARYGEDAQAQLRHSDAGMTINIYTQEIPESVLLTVEHIADRSSSKKVKVKSDGTAH